VAAQQRRERFLRTRPDATRLVAPEQPILRKLHTVRRLLRPIERALIGALMTLLAIVLERRLRRRVR
jgi:hypothetical protein